MRFRDIKEHIVNREGIESIDALRQAGYRLVKARDSDRHFLARPDDLQPLLVRLGDIAEVRFGIKTGANEFFYLEPVGTTVAELFRAGAQQPSQPTVRVRNSAGWQGDIESAWLRPVIKSPRELKTLRVRLEDLRYLVFMPPDDVRQRLHDTAYIQQRYPKAYAYIQWGERQRYHLRPSCKGRVKWWDLGDRRPAELNCNYLLDEVMRFYYCPGGFFVSDNFQELHSEDTALKALTASVVVQLFCQLGGRTPFGGGLLKVQTYEVGAVFLPNPAAFTAAQRDRLLDAFERMAQREVRSIFEELGYPEPNRDYSNIDPAALTLEQVQRASPDRYALDAVVFEVLGLSDAERLTVYRAVVELVRNRLVKARSV
jgi:hypothetical protein